MPDYANPYRKKVAAVFCGRNIAGDMVMEAMRLARTDGAYRPNRKVLIG